jgi:hypothetical protein
MPAPGTAVEFLDLVQKSGVADEARLAAYLAQISKTGGLPPEPSKAAGILVHEGLLTYFQAEQLLQGKWRRFNIGKYKVLERLGSGGMGQVFLCEHKLMRRRVAVKVLPTAKATDEASLGRFYREARAVAAVDHPNIVRAFDIDQDGNLHFLVMEYVDGTNLQDLIKRFGPLDVLRACHYIYGAAVGLQHAHEIGLVHRDIKPGNILLDRSGVIKILDMGLARFFHDESDELTKKYDENILGTADYLSPEQAEDSHAVDIRTDIYSLGATFYFLLTGSQPFPEGSIPQKLIWHRNRDPRPIQSLRPEVPEGVVAIVNKMMAKKPEDRYETPAEVMAALAPWVATPIPPPPEREMPQLSPALLGSAAAAANRGMNAGNTGSRAAGTEPLIGATPGTGSTAVPGTASLAGAPTLTGRTVTPPVQAPPPGQAPDARAGVWETLGDTPVGTERDTGRATRTTETEYRTERPAASRRKKWLVPAVIGGGVFLAIVVAFILYRVLSGDPPPGDDPNAVVAPRRLTVTSSRTGENTFPSLAAAVRSARSGDTIAIEEPLLGESVIRLGRGLNDLTIESGLATGQAPVIEFTAPGASGNGVPMFDIRDVENVTLRNLQLDGKGVADLGIQISGNDPGLSCEGISVRGVKRAGIRLHNVAGQQNQPITFQDIRVVLSQSAEAGILIDADPTLSSKRIRVRDSRFEVAQGAPYGRAGIGFVGVASDCEVTGCRFFHLNAGVSIGRGPEGQPVQIRIHENTFYDTKAGLFFPPPLPQYGGGAGTFDLTVAQNYFHKTPDLALAENGAVAAIRSSGNGHSPDSSTTPAGTKPLPKPKQPPPKPPSKPPAPRTQTVLSLDSAPIKGVSFAGTKPDDDDASFLRFTDGKRPTTVGGVEVGAK